MKNINLKNYYPELYDNDCFATVEDDVFQFLRESQREEAARTRDMYRHKAHYSLDCADGIEFKTIQTVPTPDELFEQKQANAELYNALSRLPEIQRRRVYKHYILGKSQTEIARNEGVSKMSVVESIQRGLQNMKNKMN